MNISGLDIIRKYNWQVPRYTSYPPSPYFIQSPGEADTIGLIRNSNFIGPRHISLYFHIPFCPKRCLFCGCHTEIGRTGAFIRLYMEKLIQELDLLIPLLDPKRPITQIHFGGGTPNAVPLSFLKIILKKIRASLHLEENAEIAIECDPNLLHAAKIKELGEMGFNRLSIGIQDFDLKVLESVNRRFPKMEPKEIFSLAHELGFKGNNLDLIYGLPYQTAETFTVAIEKAIEANPDRISLFPYAHVPWVKGHQSKLTPLPMADTEERLNIAWASREKLLDAGYMPIGMDHFAKPEDELAKAAVENGLHRNFQGYCTIARAGQVYALGASAISQLQQGYIQNCKDLEPYMERVQSGKLSHEIAYRMRPEDLAVRNIINSILCNDEVHLDICLSEQDLPENWKTEYLENARKALEPLIQDQMINCAGDFIQVTAKGHYATRAIASVFDPMLKKNQPEKSTTAVPRFSQAL